MFNSAVPGFGDEGELEQHLAALEAVRAIVNREREEYQQAIRRNSRKTYCVVCEKEGSSQALAPKP